jgi:serine/threonine protein kinase
VLDAFELEDGTPAIVMPLLEGKSLASVIAANAPLGVGATLAVLLPVAAAVAASHAHGIVHRDLKPDNVFLAREGGTIVVKVLDFGVAKLATDHVDDGALTAAGTLIGTPAYMAPEQALCEVDQDNRVDIWAIGAIAYELLSGCRPVEGANASQVIKSLLTQAVTPLEVLVPGLPDDLSHTVMQMLRRSKVERPSLEEVLTRLGPVLTNELGPEAMALGAQHSLAALEQNRSRSDRPSAEPLASYHTVRPPSGAGSTLESPLSTSPSRRWQRAVTVAAALGVVVAGSWLLGQRREPPSSAAMPLVSGPAASLGTTATAATLNASKDEVVVQGPATAPSVGIAASVQVPVARPRQIRKPLRVSPVKQNAALPNDKQPRPIDRTNPFTIAE